MFIFVNPGFHVDGVWIESSQNFGVTQALLYETPINPESETSISQYLLEAIKFNLGFRGMSGAAAVKTSTKQLVGMFIKKDILFPFRVNHDFPIKQKIKESKNLTAKIF